MVLDFAVNWVAVIVSAVVAFIVGMLWWGPLFGKQWMALSGKTQKDIDKAKQEGMAGKMAIMAIANILMAFVLAGLIGLAGITAWSAGMMLGFWVWLGFVATIGVGIVLWDGKPWGLFWLNSIGWLVVLLIIGAILAVWQ